MTKEKTMNQTPFMPFFTPSINTKETTILGFVGDMLLTMHDTQLPLQEHFKPLGEPKHSFDIGQMETLTFTLQIWDDTLSLPEGLIKTHLREVMHTYPSHLFEILSRAKQLTHWLQDNQYCGRCGNPLHFSPKLSALQCPECGFFAFPRLSPACIVLVSRGNEILLARSPQFTKGVYSILAGFVEAGEDAEACVHRELKEEVGLKIKNLRYFGTQPWPFPHSLMIGYFAEYESGELVLQEEEIEDAQWFTKENLPQLPNASSISYRMIQAWLKEH